MFQRRKGNPVKLDLTKQIGELKNQNDIQEFLKIAIETGRVIMYEIGKGYTKDVNIKDKRNSATGEFLRALDDWSERANGLKEKIENKATMGPDEEVIEHLKQNINIIGSYRHTLEGQMKRLPGIGKALAATKPTITTLKDYEDEVGKRINDFESLRNNDQGESSVT